MSSKIESLSFYFHCNFDKFNNMYERNNVLRRIEENKLHV